MSDAMERLKKIQQSRSEKKSRGGSFSNFLRVPEDGQIQIRILEDMEEVVTKQCAIFHQIKHEKYTQWEICLDQDPSVGQRIGADCPGCEKNAEDSDEYRSRDVYYINVIHRNAPIRKKEGKKWVETDEKADQLAVWEVTQFTAQETLEEAYGTYKSLTNREWILKKRGTGFDTTYTLQPKTNDEGDPVKTPLSEADEKLADGKADLTEKVKLKPYDEWGKKSSGKKGDEEKGGDGETASSPFLKRNAGDAADAD